MKKVILFSCISILGALVFSARFSSISNTPPLTSLSKSSQFVLAGNRTHPSMKPAWYQYFNMRKNVSSAVSKNQSLVEFVKALQPSQEGMINFEIINTSEKDLPIKTQDGSLIMIQEAKTPTGEWKPIEFWKYDWGLGANFDNLTLAPAHSVLIVAPKYEGEFNTQFRFKLKLNDSETVYSIPFEGSVDLSQFEADINAQHQEISYLD